MFTLLRCVPFTARKFAGNRKHMSAREIYETACERLRGTESLTIILDNGLGWCKGAWTLSDLNVWGSWWHGLLFTMA